MQIIATSLKARITYIKDNFGEDGFEKVLNALSEADRKIVAAPFIPTTDWIEIDTFVNFLNAAVSTVGGGNEALVQDMSEVSAQKQIVGIYRILMRVASPAFIIKKGVDVYEKIFRGSSARMVVLGPKKAALTFSGFRPEHKIMEVSSMGFCRKTLELSGAKNVKVEITRSLAAGGDSYEVTGSWE